MTDKTPVPKLYRRIPPGVLSEIRDHLDSLLQRGIIRLSTRAYAAPIVVVRKKDKKEIGLCCDYRRLNNVTRCDDFLCCALMSAWMLSVEPLSFRH